MYILEIPTRQARGIVISPKIGKYSAIITANENAPVVWPEGKEYLSIPIFFMFKFGISINGRSLVTLILRSLPRPVLIVMEIIAWIAMTWSRVVLNKKAAVQNTNIKGKDPK